MIPDPAPLFGTPSARDALGREAEAYVARALAMMNRARAMVAADRAGTIGLLAARRGALATHFQHYQRLKHGSIFDPVVRHGPPSSKVVARTMKVDCMELGEVFGAYHARWLRLGAADWQAYRGDMLATTDMLATHLNAELRAIRQLLAISDLYGAAVRPDRPAQMAALALA